jgi:hypothetical protein
MQTEKDGQAASRIAGARGPPLAAVHNHLVAADLSMWNHRVRKKKFFNFFTLKSILKNFTHTVTEASRLVGSDDATAGSVIAKHDRIRPSRSGMSNSRFCSCGVGENG